MQVRRSGSSLCEVLLALVLVALSASWALRATALTERAVGVARARADAMQRATRALADLHALPCDTTSASRSVREPRWLITASRSAAPAHRHDVVILTTVRGDTIQSTRDRWCHT